MHSKTLVLGETSNLPAYQKLRYKTVVGWNMGNKVDDPK